MRIADRKISPTLPKLLAKIRRKKYKKDTTIPDKYFMFPPYKLPTPMILAGHSATALYLEVFSAF